jgi:hypothetical protein
MKNKILAIAISFLLAVNAFATDQIVDVILYNDTLYYIYSRNLLEARDYPLAPLINKLYAQDSISRQKADSLIKGGYSWNLRGYYAEWEIRNDSLILNSIKHPSSPPEDVPLSFLFEERDVANGVLADWYSGRLHITHRNTYDAYFGNFVATFIIHHGCIIAVRENGQWRRWEAVGQGMDG